MNNSFVFIIMLLCYVIGEVYKLIFSRNKEIYNFLPIFLTIIGGIISVAMYLLKVDMFYYTFSFFEALEIGMISGASSTGFNQIFKKIILLQGGKNDIKK